MTKIQENNSDHVQNKIWSGTYSKIRKNSFIWR